MDFLKSSSKPSVQEASSIDRFIWSKGIAIAHGLTGNSSASLGLMIGGICQAISGIGIIVAHQFAPVVPSMVSFFLFPSALFMVGYSLKLRNQNRDRVQSEVRLSPAARSMVSRVLNHIGWTDPHRSQYANNWWMQMMGRKTSADLLNPISSELLNRATFQFNRIEGMVKLANDHNGRLKQLIPSIRVAAEEAIYIILNQVALLEQSPETHQTIAGQVETNIAKITELGNGLEGMIRQPDTIADRLTQSSVIDSVLDQIRQENLAHQELNSTNSQSEPRLPSN